MKPPRLASLQLDILGTPAQREAAFAEIRRIADGERIRPGVLEGKGTAGEARAAREFLASVDESGKPLKTTLLPRRPSHPLDGQLGPWRAFRYDVTAPLREPKWVVRHLLAEDEILLLSGDSSAGKSFLAYALAMAALDGGTWLGQPVSGPGRVLIVDGEMSAYQVEKRLRGFQLKAEHWERLVYLDKSQAVALDDPEQARQLADVIEAIRPSLVILDSVFSLAPTIDHNSNGAVSAFYRDVLRPLARGTALMGLHHENKPGEHGRGRAEYAATGARAWAHQADRHLTLAAKGDKEVERVELEDGGARLTYAVVLDSGKAREAFKPRLDLAIETEEDRHGQVVSTEIRVLGNRKRTSAEEDMAQRACEFLQERGMAKRGEIATHLHIKSNDGRLGRALDLLIERKEIVKSGYGEYQLRQIARSPI